MVFSIIKQAIEIKSTFEHAPLTSPLEVCTTIGMLAKVYALPLPVRRATTEEMKADLKQTLASLPVPSEFSVKLCQLLDDYIKIDAVTDELYELVNYGYEHQ